MHELLDKTTVYFLSHTQEKYELSMKELGLLVYLLAFDMPCELSVDQICNDFQQGKESVRSALHELEEKGILTREMISKPFGGSSCIYRVSH